MKLADQEEVTKLHYSNLILFVAKILLLFREQATGNRQ
jgi:hypothetical protein